MLNSLSYNVTFTSTGRNLHEKINFHTGFGAITGPNESGKSMVLEMVRWLLFGSAALRGGMSDYARLEGSLSFQVKGKTYKIDRTSSVASIRKGEDILATGTKPVNAKVVEILGFGLAVFDIACVANQNALLALGEMRPTDRKRMVDSVIGLGVIEDMAKSAGEEANALKRQYEDLMSGAKEPISPVEPDGYVPSVDLAVRINVLINQKSEYDRLMGWLSVGKVVKEQPKCDIPLDADALEDMVHSQNNLRQREIALETFIKKYEHGIEYDVLALDQMEQAWEAVDKWEQREAFLREHPMPQFDVSHLDYEETLIKLGQDKSRLAGLRDRAKHLAEHTLTCPECKHTWAVDGKELARVQEEVLMLEEAGVGSASAPTLSSFEIMQQRKFNATWDEEGWKPFALLGKPDTPVVSRSNISVYRDLLAKQDEAIQYMAELTQIRKTLEKQPDFRKMLEKRRRYEIELDEFQKEALSYSTWKAEYDQKLAAANELELVVAELPALTEQFEAAKQYESHLAFYKMLLAQYEKVKETASELKIQSDDWAKARVALTTIRAKVKQHLVPSLNKVASHLLKEMTGGQRQKIVVDEEFEIMVDDQPLGTLSGSGMAVANLAIRIALGQVLTNNIMSLFMADEIDASMDKIRAENTANSLQNLRSSISQILLVTHKSPVADYNISLGDSNDDPTDD